MASGLDRFPIRNVTPAPAFAGVRPYAIPAHNAPIDLKLDANEGPPPPREALERLLALGTDVLRRYPDVAELQRFLAARLGVPQENLLVTAGADDALDRLCRVLMTPQRNAVLTDPTFEMLPRYVRLAGARVKEVPWPHGPFPTEAMIAAVDGETALVGFVSPNNPTGTAARAEDLRRLSDALPPHAMLLADLAYTEFADEDLTPLALELSNTVVLRTLSKAWSLAGLRIGYAVGPAELLGWMRAAGPPFPVARPSVALALARLEVDDGTAARHIEQVRRNRTAVQDAFRSLGIPTTDSQGNFAFALLDRPDWLRDALAGLGIGIRAYPQHPKLSNAVRITCPWTPEDGQRLTEGIRAALAPEALLFDMDGVLVDDSESFRRTIIETARSFGVLLTMDDVSAAKAAGNANDDWELTCRLMRERGAPMEQSAVTERFEEIYQGTDEAPGLRRTETFLGTVELLERLSRRVKLGIVTGRPRKDAHRFLRQFKIEHLFSSIVVYEDGPLKPSPLPVQKALKELGVRHAWMVGDTPDDLRAARAAGVVPLGIVAPHERHEFGAIVLQRAGAARVLHRLQDLVTLLRA